MPILDTLLEVFGTTYSMSVQDSLYRMGEAALAAVPEISEISMACPNMHFIPMNLSAFGLDNNNDVFLPTDEPHGQIECTVEGAKRHAHPSRSADRARYLERHERDQGGHRRDHRITAWRRNRQPDQSARGDFRDGEHLARIFLSPEHRIAADLLMSWMKDVRDGARISTPSAMSAAVMRANVPGCPA